MRKNKAICLLLAAGLFLLAGCGQRRKELALPVVDGENDTDWVLNTALIEGLDGEATLSQALALLGLGVERAQVYTAEGEILETSGDEVLITASGELKVNGRGAVNPAGILINGPEKSNRDVYAMAGQAMERGTPVMVLFLDGFGYDTFLAAKERGDLERLGALTAKKASGVYPTITPANYAAMVTGQTPAGTGIRKRGDHRLDCDTLFERMASMGKNVQVVEGDQEMLALGVKQTLNPDLDGDGHTDREVFDSAMAILDKGLPDLIFIHFHGMDDVSHRTGPRTEAVYAKIREIDGFAGELMDRFPGLVILAADHGQHLAETASSAGEAGAHGDFRASDLMVPLLVREENRK